MNKLSVQGPLVQRFGVIYAVPPEENGAHIHAFRTHVCPLLNPQTFSEGTHHTIPGHPWVSVEPKTSELKPQAAKPICDMSEQVGSIAAPP